MTSHGIPWHQCDVGRHNAPEWRHGQVRAAVTVWGGWRSWASWLMTLGGRATFCDRKHMYDQNGINRSAVVVITSTSRSPWIYHHQRRGCRRVLQKAYNLSCFTCLSRTGCWGPSGQLPRYSVFCWTRARQLSTNCALYSPVHYCRVLLPGEFNGTIPKPLLVYSENFMMTAVTVLPYCC